MPKPPGSYLHSQAPTKIATQVAQADQLKQKVEAEARARAAAFAALLKQSGLDERRLAEAHKLAESLKNFGKEPTTKQGVLVKALGETAKLLEKFGELQAKVKAFNTELGAPAKSFVNAHAKADSAASAANMLLVAVALIAFVAAIRKAAGKFH